MSNQFKKVQQEMATKKLSRVGQDSTTHTNINRKYQDPHVLQKIGTMEVGPLVRCHVHYLLPHLGWIAARAPNR